MSKGFWNAWWAPSAAPHARDPSSPPPDPAHRDDGEVDEPAPQRPNDLDPIEFGHEEVRDHQVHTLRLTQPKAVDAMARHQHLVPFIREGVLEHVPHRRLVIHDEHPGGRHGRHPSPPIHPGLPLPQRLRPRLVRRPEQLRGDVGDLPHLRPPEAQAAPGSAPIHRATSAPAVTGASGRDPSRPPESRVVGTVRGCAGPTAASRVRGPARIGGRVPLVTGPLVVIGRRSPSRR